jgi:hypothetical protein
VENVTSEGQFSQFFDGARRKLVGQAYLLTGDFQEAVLVADEGARKGADLEQAMPVGIVPGETRDLEAEDDPGTAHADFGHETLEAFPVGG